MLKLGFCGDDCNVCPRYIATQSGDVEQLKKVAALWYGVGYRDKIVPPEELICRGCFSTLCNVAYLRDLRECALEKGIENCGKCGNYLCEKVLKVFEQTESFAKSIKEKCSKEEYECLQKAFFSKKENLDRVNREYLSQIKSKEKT
jgi:hypothetical protein